ncbi:XRE family transcriptional regulator, partial [Faecalicatena contorta]|nr:XRE family transcriptional regulator [Faecalicatena contorta]
AVASNNPAAERSASYGLSPNLSVGQQAVASVALPEDLTGYDAHMNSFAWKVAAGIAAIITGVAVGVLFDSEGTVSGLLARSEFLTFVCTIIGVIIGLAFLIPAGMA